MLTKNNLLNSLLFWTATSSNFICSSLSFASNVSLTKIKIKHTHIQKTHVFKIECIQNTIIIQLSWEKISIYVPSEELWKAPKTALKHTSNTITVLISLVYMQLMWYTQNCFYFIVHFYAWNGHQTTYFWRLNFDKVDYVALCYSYAFGSILTCFQYKVTRTYSTVRFTDKFVEQFFFLL